MVFYGRGRLIEPFLANYLHHYWTAGRTGPRDWPVNYGGGLLAVAAVDIAEYHSVVVVVVGTVDGWVVVVVVGWCC